MSSSDSDDGGYYKNFVKNFEKNRNKIREKEKNSLALEKPTEFNIPLNNKKTANNTTENQATNVSISSLDLIDEGPSYLDEVIAKNRKTLRSRNNVQRGRPSKRAKKSTNSASDPEIQNLSTVLDVTNNYNTRNRNQSRKRKETSVPENSSSSTILTSCQNSRSVNSGTQINKRGGRGRGRGKGRGKGRGRTQLLPDDTEQDAVRPAPHNIYPIISIGNTDEYYDHSDDVPLFSTKSNTECKNDVITVDDVDPLADNEELQVKVLWQSIDVFKFAMRKHQKLKKIFDFFMTEKKVSVNNLCFFYNNKILSCDDTPTSIEYSIAKFIDGGVVLDNVTTLVEGKKENITGIEIKFQSCNRKNTYKVYIQNNDKLSLAMLKCAEHLNVSLNKLKFEFDGECLSGNNTPKEMDFEGGECIDVKIIS